MNESSAVKIEDSKPAASCCGPAAPGSDAGILGRVVSALRSQMAWTVAGVAFFALLVLDAGQVPETLRFTGINLIEIAPFLGVAIGLAAYAKASGADSLIAAAIMSEVVPLPSRPSIGAPAARAALISSRSPARPP